MARFPAPGRKDIILNAALACFGKKGYKGSSMADVASEAGVATGTLYLYFKNKQEILSACAHRFHEEHRLFTKDLLAQNALDAPEKLLHYLLNRHSLWARETRQAQPGTDLATEMLKASSKVTQAEQKLWTNTLSTIMEEGQTMGVFFFRDLHQEMRIFFYSLSAYFPLPGVQYAFHPTEDELKIHIEWFCQKWSLK